MMEGRKTMQANDNDVFGAVIRKLERLGTLDDADRAAVHDLPVVVGQAGNNSYLVRERGSAGDCYLILDGYVCRHKLSSNGGRQIVSFHMAGDIVDLQHLLFSVADHNIQSITDIRFARIPAKALRDLARRRPMVAEALWRDTLIDASIYREWVLNVGRRDAKSRIAHMLCEFAVRREAAGLGSPERFDLPMSQEQIGDATGLTSVHVNRMLRALAEEGMIARGNRDVQIVNWANLRRTADFDPIYLHAA
jgi:CRP-like cAMP-binding protein